MQNSRPDEDEKEALKSLQSFLQTVNNIDTLCETPHFTHGEVPLDNQAFFKGKLHAAPPFTGIKVKTRVINPDGKEDVVEKEYKELDYDSMDVYQKAHHFMKEK